MQTTGSNRTKKEREKKRKHNNLIEKENLDFPYIKIVKYILEISIFRYLSTCFSKD